MIDIHVYPSQKALHEICRKQNIPKPEYLWEAEEKSLTLCHTDRIVTVKDAGDKIKAGHVAADIMMCGLYGEHELQDRHQKFDDAADKAMDTPKWEAKLAHYHSEEGKQERISLLEENTELTDEQKASRIDRIKEEEHETEVPDYSSLCQEWQSKRRTIHFNSICKQCKLQHRISAVKPEKPIQEDAEEKEGKAADGEKATEETTQDEQTTQEEEGPKTETVKAVVWKNGEKENPVLEIEVSGEERFSILRLQLIDNAIEQLLADEHITQAAIDAPIPKPPVNPTPMNSGGMQSRYQNNGQQMQYVPMMVPANMVPMMQQPMMQMMNPQMIQQQMMQMQMQQQMMQQMVMQQAGLNMSGGSVGHQNKRGGKRTGTRSNKNKNKKKSKKEDASAETVEVAAGAPEEVAAEE